MSPQQTRYNITARVYLTWQDKKGNIRRCPARCVDVSESGARIETIDEMAPQSIVAVQSDCFSHVCHATVRYCRRLGMKYQVGLQFSAPLELKETHMREEVFRARARKT